jgi:arsenate reductase
MARQAMRDLYGLEMAGQRPKSLEDFLGQRFDYVITVCDVAAESCPVFPGAPDVIHWSFEDPAAVEGDEAKRRRAFEQTARDLASRIRIWMALPGVSSRIAISKSAHGR